MAWVEAASVYYLRVLVDRLEPYQANPLPMQRRRSAQVELVREAATLVMLLTSACSPAGRGSTRLGYTAIAFGVWDIFYYVFLRSDLRLAEVAVRLGHPLPAAAAVVGAGARARVASRR